MEQINATAIRNGKSIEVLIKGFLPDSCHTATIADIYPGRNRTYIIDPGVAQVFVEVNSKPGAEFCLEVLTPWSATAVIPDPDHTEVEIYINNK